MFGLGVMELVIVAMLMLWVGRGWLVRRFPAFGKRLNTFLLAVLGLILLADLMVVFRSW